MIQVVGAFAAAWVVTQTATRMNLVGKLPEELYHFTMFVLFLAPMVFFAWPVWTSSTIGIVTAYFGVYKY